MRIGEGHIELASRPSREAGRFDAALEAAAKAMFDAHVQSLYKKIGDRTFDVAEFKEFFLGLTPETERALAVLSFAYIDATLTDLMASHFNPGVTGGAQSLLDQNGPFGSASARIKGCAALYWIRKSTFTNLDLARKIRNEFAHNPRVTTLSHPKIAGLLGSMEARESDMLRELKVKKELSPRIRFHIRCMVLCCDVIVDLISRPVAVRMGLPPETAHPPWEQLPQPLKELLTGCAETALKLVGEFSEVSQPVAPRNP